MTIARYLPLMLLVVMVSGCTSSTSTVELGDGVIIKDYDVSFTDVYSGECVDLGIVLKNTGSVDAEKVFVELLGIDQDWYDGKSWGTGCKAENGGPWSGWEKTANELNCRWNPEHPTSSLSAPRPDLGVDGESIACTWSYKAPELPAHVEMTYPVTLRAFYQYQTSVVKAVTLLSQEEMKNLMEQGSTLPADTQSSTRSPVRIDVTTSTPLRVYANRIEFPIRIDIDNIGGGFTCVGYSSWDNIKDCRTSQQSSGKTSWRKIMLEVEADSIIELSEECSEPFEFTLYKGQKNTITCTATVYANDLPSERTQTMVRVYAYYNYVIDKEIDITVHGSVD